MAIEAELARARTVHRQGRIGEAVPVYERILQAQPEHEEALHLLGVARLQTGDPRAALELLEHAASLAPDRAKIQNNLGNALLALGRAAEAADRYRAAAKGDPEFADAQYNLGTALGSLEKIEEAGEAYREALRIDPGHAAASNNLAAIHQARGEFRMAVELYRKALDNAPQSAEFRTNLAAAQEALKREKTSRNKPATVSETPEFRQDGGTDVKAALLKAKDLHEQREYREAERSYREILDRNHGHPEVSYYLGLVLLQTGRGKEAVAFLERAAEMAPDNPFAHDRLGQAYTASGQTEMAVAAHRRASEIAPENPDMVANLALALDFTGSPEEADTFYRKALEIAPDHFHALLNFSTMLYKFGRFREAIPLLRKAHDLDPGAAQPIATLAFSHERLNEPDAAEAATETLIRIAPDHPARPLLDAYRCMRQGKPEQAVALLRAATLDPNQPAIHMPGIWFELGRALDAIGDFGAAFAAVGEGHKLRQKEPEFSRETLDVYRDRIAAYRGWFHGSRLKTAPQTGKTQTNAPVFFVGFPRSGTTLMEQALGAHPAFVTTNEHSPLERMFLESEQVIGRHIDLPGDLEHLDHGERNRLLARFLAVAGAVTGADPAKKRIVDKLPINIAELGPANWMFPNGLAIVALRDPRDVVLSCYLQRFRFNASTIHLMELGNAARFYAQVMGLWLHYRDVLTMPWIEYRYEDLVDNFAGTVGRVLAFLGEDWDDSVGQYADRAQKQEINTPSFRAVTEPIYKRSVARWRNYQAELAPVLPILEPFVKEFGYEPS